MQIRSEVKAGSVIVISLIFFAGVVLSIGKLGDLWKKKQTLAVLFSDVQGLKVDDPVQFMGLERGKVESIEVSSYQDGSGFKIPMIEVIAQITYADPLPVDTKITVDRSLTGNTALKIEPGRAPEKFAAGQKIMGLGAVSMGELATKAGVMAKRLDDFLADLTDRNITGSLRSVVGNLKQVSDDVKTITGSLSQSIPGSEKNLVATLKNLAGISHSVDEIVAGNREKISGSLQSIGTMTASLSRSSHSLEEILSKNQDNIHSSLGHLEKTTSNLKALSREVRWQPWVLLNKPDEVEIRERSVYNSALEFSEGAENLNQTVKHLVELMNSHDNSKENMEKYKLILGQIHQNLEKSTLLERQLWTTLTEKAQGKTKDKPKE